MVGTQRRVGAGPGSSRNITDSVWSLVRSGSAEDDSMSEWSQILVLHPRDEISDMTFAAHYPNCTIVHVISRNEAYGKWNCQPSHLANVLSGTIMHTLWLRKSLKPRSSTDHGCDIQTCGVYNQGIFAHANHAQICMISSSGSDLNFFPEQHVHCIIPYLDTSCDQY